VTYTQGGQASVYTKNPSTLPVYPTQSVANPGYLVSAFLDSNGQGGSVTSTYSYAGLQSDAAGRGLLGFASITSTNSQSGISILTSYNQAWPYSGLVASAVTTATTNENTVTISNASNTYAVLALPNAYYSSNSTVPGVGGTETALCNICFPYVSTGTKTSADLSNNDLGTVTSSGITYDNFGNQLTGTVSSKLAADTSSFVTSSTNTWDNDSNTCVATHGATYVIGRLCTSSVTKTNESGASLTRTSAATYFATGLTQTEVLEPTHTTLPSDDLQVTNTYTRDGFGNVLSKVQSWLDPVSVTTLSRTTSMTYSADGRFPATATNAMGQTESYQFDPATGVKTQLVDINGLITTWQDDGLGRVTLQTLPDGNATAWAYNQCGSGDCLSSASTVTITTHSNAGTANGVPELSYANPLGQVIRSMSYGFTGTPIVTDHTFDAQSRPAANYQPAFASGATAAYPSGVLANEQTLDNVNRPLTTVTLDTGGALLTTTISYAGNIRTTINPAGQTRKETNDVLGELIGVQIDAFNNAPQTNTAFVYDPFGNLVQTTDPAGNNINVTYDVMGHKIQLNDPDLGIINYSVDPVGRTWKQISPNENAASVATTFQFDLLDRMIGRTEPDLNSSFIYDIAGATGPPLTAGQIASCQSARSCGKLVESYTAPLASGNVGMINTSNSSKESDTVYNYDSLGRPANNTLTLDASLNMTFYSETDYDTWSRPITQIYQHGSDPQKEFDQRYNGYGYLQSVQRSGLTLWQAMSQDASNRVVTAHLATAGGASDGLITTRCYNVNTGRLADTMIATPAASVACGTTPAVVTVQESYGYDVLGNVQQRNEAWNQGITGTIATQSFSEGFTYDGLNRIYTSTVVNQAQQSFTYTVDGNIKSNPTAGTYTYTGGTSGGPHAVKTVSGAATAFTYDADGNQLTGNSRTNTWTSFDMPETLTYTGSGNQFPTTSSQFTYGPNHERRTQSQGSTAIIYYGGAQEVQTDGSHNVTEIKTYWPMGLGVEIDRPAQTASELDWTHTDHLGSVIAITDIDGNLKEALGYDTWGNRRNAAGAPVSIATTLTAEVNENTDDKGYTNAEQITSLELVHLNGRVYDPLIGKFLSGDPLVADPKNGQNYNRYAYVLNNPMNATDPTGFKDKMASICLAADYCGGSGGYDGLQGVDPGATLAGTTTTTFTPTSTTASTAPDGSITLTTTYSVSTDTVAGTGDATQGQTNAYASYTVAQANAATNNTVTTFPVTCCVDLSNSGSNVMVTPPTSSGGVDYLAATKAGFGVVGNGLGIAVGLGVAAAGPEGFNQLLGGYLVASGSYGATTNAQDFAAAVGWTNSPVPSNVNSLSRAVATFIDPGSSNAQAAADIVDLSAALAAGRVETYTRIFATLSGPFASAPLTVTSTWGLVPQQVNNAFGFYQAAQNVLDAAQR